MSAEPLPEQLAGYRAAFSGRSRRSEPAWLRAAREAALARFERRGFPTTRDEAWRYTSVAPIERARFAPADGDRRGDLVSATARRLSLGGAFRGSELVFVNGRHAPDLSSWAAPSGVEALPLEPALSNGASRLEGLLGSQARDLEHPFLALNDALFEDGVALFLAPGARPERPIHLLYLSTGEGATACHPRTLVLLGQGACCTLVESYGGPNGESYLANAVTEIRLEDGARLDHYSLERQGLDAFHTASLAVNVGRDARYSNHAVTIGGQLARNDVSVVLDGPGAEAQLLGLFVANFKQHIDSHTRIDHAKPHGQSRETYKGILNGGARGVFHGRIVVHQDAQHSDAYQTNKNLLLSEHALVNSTPQLEIFANDVKCKHGSTTGQLDADALFYLRTRGISEQAARGLLTYAFASDLVSRIEPLPVRESLDAFLRDRLPPLPKEDAA